MATVARLNQVASQSPRSTRKRPRTSDLQDATPKKQRAIEDDVKQQRSAEGRFIASRSATRLRSRLSLPAATPVPKPRGKDVYQLQDSPGRDDETRNSKPKTQEEKKGTKKKRVLNRRKSDRIEEFDEQRVGTINPLARKSLTLNTVDSPAKNTRTKRENPLKKLDTNFVTKVVSLDAESAGVESPELGMDREQNRPLNAPQPRRRPDEVNSQHGTEKTEETDVTDQEDEQAPRQDQDPDDGEGADHAGHERETTPRSTSVERGVPIPADTIMLVITDEDRNYMSREQEKMARQKQQESEDRQEGTASETPTHTLKGKRKRPESQARRQLKVTDPEEHTDTDEDEEAPDETAASQTQTESKRGRGRPAKISTGKGGRAKMSEEEKLAKKEARARQMQENAAETAQAAVQDRDARGKKFVAGIEDLAAQVGGLEPWSKLGAGAVMIVINTAKSRTEMQGIRAQNLWKKLVELKEIFSSNEEADEERVSDLLSSLKRKARRDFLTRSGEDEQGDSTIIDLYECLIPGSVRLMRKALKERFVATHKISWQEIRTITEVAISLCDIASDWQPRPSTLDAGPRKEVRQSIRPNLAIILNTINDVETQIEYEEKKKREHAAFTKRQLQKKEEKERMWEKKYGYSSGALPRPAEYAPSDGGSQQSVIEVEQPEEVHAPADRSPTPTFDNPGPPQISLQRQQTEEIPAPDPTTIWTENENVALLNGLQKYLDDDRYARILSDSKFARALREKDVDQCMARARFYQAGFSQVLKEKMEAGDDSFDWLRTV